MRRRDLGRRGNACGGRGGIGGRALALVATGTLALTFGLAGPAGAASSAESGVHSAVLVVIPRAKNLSVFEEVTLSRYDHDPAVAIVPGYRELTVSAGEVERRGNGFLHFRGSPSRVVFRYALRRAGARLQLTWPGAVDRLEVFLSRGWYLPPGENPAWQYLGSGTIVKTSTEVFNGYQTETVHAGETTTLALGKGSPVVAPVPAAPEGTNRAGAVVLFLLAGLASASWVVLYRRLQKVKDVLANETAGVKSHELS